jgi:hypothetical protein
VWGAGAAIAAVAGAGGWTWWKSEEDKKAAAEYDSENTWKHEVILKQAADVHRAPTAPQTIAELTMVGGWTPDDVYSTGYATAAEYAAAVAQGVTDTKLDLDWVKKKKQEIEEKEKQTQMLILAGAGVLLALVILK